MSTTPGPFRSLATKLVLPLLAGCLVGVAGLWAAISQIFSDRVHEQLASRAQSAALMVSYAVEADLNEGELQRVVNSLGAEASVEAVTVVVGSPLQVLVCTRHDWIGRGYDELPVDLRWADSNVEGPLAAQALQLRWQGEQLLCRLPLLQTERDGSHLHGFAVVQVDGRLALSESRRLATMASIALAAGIALAALALWFLAWYLVLRPVRSIVRGIQSGPSWTPIPVHANDELGMLVRQLNSTASARRAAEARLEAANAELHEQNRQVQRERRLLQTIVNSVPHAIFWKDRDSTYLGCNLTFASIAGYDDPAVLVGRNDFEMPWGPSEAEQYVQCDRQVMSGQRVIENLEEPLTGPRGEERVLLTSKTPLRDEQGRVIGMVGIFNDVTAFKTAQRERDKLLVEAAELSHIIRESPQEVYILDRATLRFVEVNRGACIASGFDVEELLTMSPLDLDLQIDETQLRELMSRFDAGTPEHFEFQSLVRRKSGATAPVQISLHGADYRGRAVCVAFLSDLSEVKSLERRLSQAQKLEALGQLSAGIAHEINTPLQFVEANIEFVNASSVEILRVIDRFHELLVDQEPLSWTTRKDEMEQLAASSRFDYLRKEVPKAIKESLDGVLRTVKILKAMKNFSHPGNDQRELVDVNQAVENTLVISRNRWKHAARVEADLDPALPAAPAFAAELNQALLNLVVNAADAIAERYSDDELGQITVRTRRVADAVEIDVQDNGGGIPAELQQRVFDPFFTTKEVGKGTGLGLAVTHDVVVNLHGGRLTLHSQAGAGALFTITLPLHPPADNEGDPANPQPVEAAQLA